ncbi:hybrid sensor histidine kinase/response regulator [Pseudoxanthomonas yeongjuensis]|uniref:hybrid sensor histidine kinase/response regulator n=1 Tax=Pseudoxanthomonas yeongjuensis TaxID=377616 RepID=UPI0013920151|nr:hybrid sensor histidine kinase/response regulator [Pseudoxanthomonas yeongjuensis]KAF1718545.1 hybrid sensor histidine kinase/response regulator [Pseudoxanthomonas yeongjuensis]
MGLRVWLLGLCLVCCVAAQAAVPEIPRFRVLGAADGLPNTTIPALARDRAGYLWVATHDGLARYDGVGFKVWRHDPEDPASLPGNIVQAMHIDGRDRIWVATENGGLSMMGADRKGFRHYRLAEHPQMGSDDVFAITSRGDALWFGGFGGGLCRLDADGKFTHFSASETDAGSLPSDDVLSLAFDQKGVLWIGTIAGLANFDGQAVRRVAFPQDRLPIIYSLVADGANLWVGTSDGMSRREASGWTSPAWSPMFARPNAVIAMVNTDDGEYWLGGQGGLWRTEGEGAPAPVDFDTSGSGVARLVQTLLRQPDGGLWVPVKSRGLGYLRSDWRRIAALSTAQGLGGGVYRGIAPGTSGRVWLVSDKGRIERLDTTTGEIELIPWHQQEFGKLILRSVLEDRQGRLWLGHSKGLARLDLSSHAFKSWPKGAGKDATPDAGPVDWLVQTADGSVWLSSLGGGLQRRDGESGAVLDQIDADSGHGLTAVDTEMIAAGPDGALWLAGAQGLLRWEQAARRFLPVPGTGGERVFSFAFQDPARLWLHRLSGLELWRRDARGWRREKRLAVAEGVPAVESTGLEIDAGKRLWLASRRGLTRIDPQSGQVRNFGVRDGLLSQEFNDRALFITDDGVLTGSATDGSIMLLDTRLPDPVAVTPNLVLDSIQVSRDDRTVSLPGDGGFDLQPGDHELQISARLLSFEDPLANRYRSRLQGFDKDWVDQGASGERVFSALPPGRYVLHVQAFDVAGNASPDRTLSFRVLPPWWRSGWGIVLFVLVGLLLLGMSGALYRRRLRTRTAWQLNEHKRELAEQASLAKTRFLATLGHEVRTPMTGVLGMSELLLATPLDEKQRSYTHAIQNAGSHLLRLVNDALDIARIEAGKLELQRQDFDLRRLVDEVVGLTAPMAEQRGLTFADEIAAGTPGVLQGDPVRMRQILLNLLGNAIKFTERGGVTLRVSPAPPQGVRFEIADTGPGINEEQQTRLFQRFEQAEGARTAARYGGSGLGLAICQELALAMGGRIQVRSAPGVGTCFTVDLPLATSTRMPEALSRTAAAVPAGSEPLRILLVEDDPTVAEVIASLLRARGHHVAHVAHGLAALAKTAANVFDIALLDLDLPGLDGLALARQLRAQAFTAPLLAVTARADADAETLARAAGFDGFLRKPVTGEMLAEAIAGVLA